MNLLTKGLLKISFLFLLLYVPSLTIAAEKAQVDVLFLYSPAVSEHYNGAASSRINHIIETTNAIYSSSHLNIQVSAAEIQQYDIDDTINPYTLMKNAKNSQDIEALRNKVGADLVVMYRLYHSGEPCGLGYRPTALNSHWVGISFVAINCAAYKTAHEIGHNMGLGHSYAQGSTPFLKYARGHGVRGKFATIMAYSSAYKAPKVYKFSSPDYRCKGITCGVKEGAIQEADAVKALRQTAPIVAKLRASPVEEQCSTEQHAIYSSIETEYQAEKNKVAELSQQIQTTRSGKEIKQRNYQTTLRQYKDLINKEFYPHQRIYQAARTKFVEELPKYRKGEIRREDIIKSYFIYKNAREAYIATYNKVRSHYTAQYLPAYKAVQAVTKQLTALQKSYKVEQTKLARLQADYDEAKRIYNC